MAFVAPGFVEEGMKVIAPLGDPSRPRAGIRGEVIVAAGYHARVVTSQFVKWFHIDNLRIETNEQETA